MDYRTNPFQHGRSHQLNLVKQRELMHSLRGEQEEDWSILWLAGACAALVAMLMIGMFI